MFVKDDVPCLDMPEEHRQSTGPTGPSRLLVSFVLLSVEAAQQSVVRMSHRWENRRSAAPSPDAVPAARNGFRAEVARNLELLGGFSRSGALSFLTTRHSRDSEKD
jgi:hypothetical protein